MAVLNLLVTGFLYDDWKREMSYDISLCCLKETDWINIDGQLNIPGQVLGR